MIYRVKKLFALEAATGVILLIATFIALLVANSDNFQIYHQFFSINLPLNLNFVGIYKDLSLQAWINDGLMAIFFFLIGLELKEEIIAGELSSKSKAMLPAIAAIGGVIMPALIFYFFNHNQPQNLHGFAVPTATDIAFAYGVLCLFGNKIPKSLKVFLISLAIFDDLLAIIIIAVVYSQNIVINYIAFCLIVFLALGFLNFKNHAKLPPYLILGAVLWVLVLKSGIHPTVAGIALAMFIPHSNNLLSNLIKKIAPAVNFLILPIFAFANSGVRIENFSLEILTTPLVLGIVFGLFFGKQIGVMLFSFVAVKCGWANLPSNLKGNTTWLQFYGVSILTGIGFTMSFFIGSLAFANNNMLFDQVKIGVLCASFLSATVGIIVLSAAFGRKNL